MNPLLQGGQRLWLWGISSHFKTSRWSIHQKTAHMHHILYTILKDVPNYALYLKAAFLCSLQSWCFPQNPVNSWKIFPQMKRSGQNLAFAFKGIVVKVSVSWRWKAYVVCFFPNMTLTNAGSLLESRWWSGRNTVGQQVR